MPQLTQNQSQLHVALILSLALILASAIFSSAYRTSKKEDNTITITGTASQIIESDRVKWSFSLNKNTYQFDNSGSNGSNDTTTKSNHMSSITEAVSKLRSAVLVIDHSAEISVQPLNDNNNDIEQTIVVESSSTGAIGDFASRAADALDLKDISLNTRSIEYYVSNLETLEHRLANQAIQNAKDQAQTLSNNRVGSAKTINAPLYDVTAETSPDSNNDYYRSNDTSSIKKKVKATINVIYHLE